MFCLLLSRMENETEIAKRIGKQNLQMIREAIRKSKIQENQVRAIARQMGGSVLGTFNTKTKKNEELVDVFNFMLETWYEDVLFETEVDGYELLQEILKDDNIRLKAIAKDLIPVKPRTLNIGLPTSHFKIQGLQHQDKTGALASPSNQGRQGLTCASHAVGKAILEILDYVGWDADQETIIDSLIKKFQSNLQAENPDIFNDEMIKVHVTKKEDKSNLMDVEVEIHIQRQIGQMIGSHTYDNTSPIVANREENGLRMVLDWDWFDSNDGQYKPHAIYAREYSTKTEKYSCINSWGRVFGEPQVSKADVRAVYYVSIIQKNL